MNDSIQQDLLAAHADALVAGDHEYHTRYSALFDAEMDLIEPLFALAEKIYTLFQEPVVMHSEFRADLKLDLLAQARQQEARGAHWRWAALGASAAVAGVAGVIAAAAWRNNHGGLWRPR